MLLKEYRICMPMTVAEYRIGQLYMIAKHSNEQSEKGEGVEVMKNEKCEHPVHGHGQFTEKRVHLSSRLPTWIQKLIPKIFYITEKAWNYYPFTITEYTCSFMPKFTIYIETKYADDNGCSKNLCNLSEADLKQRTVEELDIAYDEIQEKHYKEAEDPTKFVSKKTGRGPLQRDWRDFVDPVMCSYKAVKVKFEVWGLQTKVEEFTHRCIKEILLLGHRQAFTWIDEWFDMTIEDIRKYEQRMHAETNEKVLR
uniref:Cytoplasmic phosphatidylinositol transfer protein 1 n=1 Tax=Crassostrea virginica TaxID=6565 RepID=A0A8B8CQS1_CRAVI|nr:cytoplasmic phosphatidylinositol transfer protein 1-like [Crassostrea virginica]